MIPSSPHLSTPLPPHTLWCYSQSRGFHINLGLTSMILSSLCQVTSQDSRLPPRGQVPLLFFHSAAQSSDQPSLPSHSSFKVHMAVLFQELSCFPCPWVMTPTGPSFTSTDFNNFDSQGRGTGAFAPSLIEAPSGAKASLHPPLSEKF